MGDDRGCRRQRRVAWPRGATAEPLCGRHVIAASACRRPTSSGLGMTPSTGRRRAHAGSGQVRRVKDALCETRLAQSPKSRVVYAVARPRQNFDIARQSGGMAKHSDGRAALRCHVLGGVIDDPEAKHARAGRLGHGTLDRTAYRRAEPDLLWCVREKFRLWKHQQAGRPVNPSDR
jgi:hypothetical protein